MNQASNSQEIIPTEAQVTGWYAVYVKPRQEKKVAEQLTERGISNYLPLLTTLKQWSDRKKKVAEPLFKSYLFVNIDYEKDHLEVLSIPGIITFVRTGKSPAFIRNSIIDAIRISLMHYDDIITTSESLEINQQVTVIAGPLKGFEGIIANRQGNKYFGIKFPELGTHVLIKIPASFLEAQ